VRKNVTLAGSAIDFNLTGNVLGQLRTTSKRDIVDIRAQKGVFKLAAPSKAAEAEQPSRV
jgi:hypothetical protein